MGAGLVGCTGQAVEQHQAIGSSGWQGADPMVTNCPPCNSINGTCDTNTCQIVCNATFTDCNDDLTDGCECSSPAIDPECGGCVRTSGGTLAGACYPTLAAGLPCAKDCVMNGICDANGKCVGIAAPDHSPCAIAPSGCGSGECIAGACTCFSGLGTVPRPDMAPPDPRGYNIPACDMTFSSVPTVIAPLALLAALGLLLRRRRKS
jgi:MYXO-CTERM domain-containing protein